MKLNHPLRTLALTSLCAASLALSGCLLTSSNATYETGRRITPSTLDQVTPGETTEDWLIATLDQPSARTSVEGQPDVEILRYDFSEHHESEGAFLFLYAGSTRRTKTLSTFFEVQDGIVTRYWSE